MKHSRGNSSISALAALLVLAVFAAGIFAVLISGATGYKRLTAMNQEAYNRRTAVQYIGTKLRQAQSAEAVELSDFGDTRALVIHQALNGKDYVSRIYCYQGYLMELFSSASGDFSPEDGEKLLELQGLQIYQDGELLSFELTEQNGDTLCFKLALRGESEAAA